MAIDREATLKNAEKFLRVGRLDAAIAEYARVVEEFPRDWNTANTLGDLYARGGQSQRAVPLYSGVADHLLAEGFYPKAAALFRKILKITPDDETAQLRLAEIAARQGLMADARAYYSAVENRRRQRGDAAGADEIIVRLGALDPEDLDARIAGARAAERRGQLVEAAEQYRQLYDEFLAEGRESDANGALRDSIRCNPESRGASLLLLARVELRDARFDEARALLLELIATGADTRASVVNLARELAEGSPKAAACCVQAAADGFLAEGDLSSAAKLLQDYATRVPDHVPTLLKLVEVCVDGGLEDLVFDAQALLADAYLAGGNAAEARVIAEDLVTRDPRNPVHVERLRRTLQALDVADVDAVVSELTFMPPEIDDTPAVAQPAPAPLRDPTPQPQPAHVSAGGRAVPAPPPAAPTGEIDLTALLGELQGQAPMPEVAARATPELEQVFAEMRADSAGDADEDASGDHLDLARAYFEMGTPQEAIGSLQMAARSPRYRFVAASMLGEIYRDEGDLRAAIEWFERAAEVPPPEPERGRALLYDLADLLETVGETARSLAVFLELDAEAPGYRDVADRIARLSRIETEG